MAQSRIPPSNSPKSEAAPAASRRRLSPELRRKAVELVPAGKNKLRGPPEIGCSSKTARLWVKKAKEKLAERNRPVNYARNPGCRLLLPHLIIAAKERTSELWLRPRMTLRRRGPINPRPKSGAGS